MDMDLQEGAPIRHSRGEKVLLGAVIVMGVMIVVGLAVLVGVVATRAMGRHHAPLPSAYHEAGRDAALAGRAEIRADEHLSATSILPDGRVLLTIESSHGARLLVWSPDVGRITAALALTQPEPSAGR